MDARTVEIDFRITTTVFSSHLDYLQGGKFKASPPDPEEATGLTRANPDVPLPVADVIGITVFGKNFLSADFEKLLISNSTTSNSIPISIPIPIEHENIVKKRQMSYVNRIYVLEDEIPAKEAEKDHVLFRYKQVIKNMKEEESKNPIKEENPFSNVFTAEDLVKVMLGPKEELLDFSTFAAMAAPFMKRINLPFQQPLATLPSEAFWNALDEYFTKTKSEEFIRSFKSHVAVPNLRAHSGKFIKLMRYLFNL